MRLSHTVLLLFKSAFVGPKTHHSTVQPLSLHITITVTPFDTTPAAFLSPMLRLFKVTFFFFWSVGRFEAFTERPWYIKVEEFRSFLNFFISGALSEGPYLKYTEWSRWISVITLSSDWVEGLGVKIKKNAEWWPGSRTLEELSRWHWNQVE